MLRPSLAGIIWCLALLPGTALYADPQSGSGESPAAQQAHEHGNADVAAAFPADLAGVWRSRPDEIALTGDFDREVWGPGAKSIRIVDLTLKPSGGGTIRVTRSVVNARGATVRGSRSIEEAEFTVAGPGPGYGTRTPFDTTIAKGERRYPDMPNDHWSVDGFELRLVPFEGDRGRLEIRWDTPEGDGSFWETLMRVPAGSRRAS